MSGAGKAGLAELTEQARQVLDGEPIHPSAFQHQIAFNLIPHIDVWQEEDYTKEEMKLVHETHKILDDYDIKITPTAVRVPVFRSHAESIYIETEEPISADEARELLEAAPRIIVQDKPHENIYPMPVDTADTDDIYVGRIRNDLNIENGLALWVCFDQIRKGAAANAVQIAELLLENDWI